MIHLGFLIVFLVITFVYVIIRTIKNSTAGTDNFPSEEEEVHLFAERPYPHEFKKVDSNIGKSVKVSQKDKVIAYLNVHGKISKEDAKELGISKLPMYIHRLRKHYIIDNIIVDGKFSHYKMIRFKGE